MVFQGYKVKFLKKKYYIFHDMLLQIVLYKYIFQAIFV